MQGCWKAADSWAICTCPMAMMPSIAMPTMGDLVRRGDGFVRHESSPDRSGGEHGNDGALHDTALPSSFQVGLAQSVTLRGPGCGSPPYPVIQGIHTPAAVITPASLGHCRGSLGSNRKTWMSPRPSPYPLA